MGLDKKNENYYYNLGRCVAIVEVMQGIEHNFYGKVALNPFAYLPFHLAKALAKDWHNLHKELLPVADVVLNNGELPHGIFTGKDKTSSFPVGYYQQKKYLEDTYHGIYGKEETTITESAPASVAPIADNEIEELTR